MLDLCRRYAGRSGLAVLCIDAVDHGERRPQGQVPPGIPARWHSTTASRMAHDWETATSALARLGAPRAYVGFSMGAIFGPAVVARLATIDCVVLVVGGIPRGRWLDDPPLEALLLEAAAKLGDRKVLMANTSRDELFPADGTVALFNAISGTTKRLTFWDGSHADWPDDMVEETLAFLERTVGQISAEPSPMLRFAPQSPPLRPWRRPAG